MAKVHHRSHASSTEFVFWRMTMATLISTLGLLLADLFLIPGFSQRASVVTVFYGLLASALTSFVVAGITIRLSRLNAFQKHRTALAILGVDALTDKRSAIVVPVFPINPLGGYDQDQSGIQGPLKGLENLGTHAYSRNDVHLLTCIIRIFASSGLPSPLILQDDQVSESFRSAGLRLLCRDPRFPQDPESEMQSVIVLGLWSNLLTLEISNDADSPVHLVGTGKDRLIRLQQNCSSGSKVDTPADPHMDRDKNETIALLARLGFAECPVTILGGTRGLGGARLGEALVHGAAELRQAGFGDGTGDGWGVARFHVEGAEFGDTISLAPWYSCQLGPLKYKRLTQLTTRLPSAGITTTEELPKSGVAPKVARRLMP